MDKIYAKKFSLYFISIFVLFFILALVFRVSGFHKYEDHVVKYYKNPNHLATYFNQNNDSFLASGGEVQAFPGERWLAGRLANRVAKQFYDCSSPDVLGTSCDFLSTVPDAGAKVIIGCTQTDLQRLQVEGEAAVDPEKCDYQAGIQPIFDSDISGYMQGEKYAGGGILGYTSFVHGAVTTEYSNLVDLNMYAAKTMQQIPFVSANEAYAQTGPFSLFLDVTQSTALSSTFFDIWEGVRNLTYYLIIIPVIAFGFAIMFRMQINPQTQITLMQAIPRFLVVILLITFSYPLSALIIQLTRPITTVVVGLLQTFAAETPYTFTTFWDLVGGITASANAVAKGAAALFLGFIWLLIATISFIRYVAAGINIIVRTTLLVTFSPLIFLMAAFPGREGIIKQYFVNLFSLTVGLALITSMFVASWLFISLGIDSNQFIIFITFSLIGLQLLWQAPSAKKLVSNAMGVQPLFGDMQGQQQRR